LRTATVLLALGGLTAACTADDAAVPVREARYYCEDGQTFTARFYRGYEQLNVPANRPTPPIPELWAELDLGGGRVRLDYVPGSTGFIYRGSEHSFAGDGGEATLSTRGVATSCRAG
jgi:hypothetical protein